MLVSRTTARTDKAVSKQSVRLATSALTPWDWPIRYRAEVMAPGEDFDQTGFELPPAPEAPAEARGQGQLFDD